MLRKGIYRRDHALLALAAAVLAFSLVLLAPPRASSASNASSADVLTEHFVLDETTLDEITTTFCGFPVEQHLVWRVVHVQQELDGKRFHDITGGPTIYTWTNLRTGRSIEFLNTLSFHETFVERSSTFKSHFMYAGMNYRLKTPEGTFVASGSFAIGFEGTHDDSGALIDFHITGHVFTPNFLHVYPVLCVFLGAIDSDGDYLPDTQGIRTEKAFRTDPTNPDTDGDGYLDGIEVANETDPRIAASHPTGAIGDVDKDDDFLEDGTEVLVFRTDPTNPDTDGDGSLDGVEVIFGTDPTKARSHP
ncbi:MAG: hypothetical protein ACRDOF_10040 [Gaiellaceae bacterium]